MLSQVCPGVSKSTEDIRVCTTVWILQLIGRHILIASFALELKIERSLVAAAHALDKRDRKTVSAFDVGTPRYSNLSQLSTGSPFAKRTFLTEVFPRCIALVLLWLIVRPILAAEVSSR